MSANEDANLRAARSCCLGRAVSCNPQNDSDSNRHTVYYERTRVVRNPLDPAELQATIENVHRAGMPGVFAEVRDGNQVWRGAAGVADVVSGRPVTVEMRHRVGSITKTFTAAAVLQQVE